MSRYRSLRYITFDAWETLVHPRDPVALQYLQVAKDHNFPCTYDQKEMQTRLKDAIKQVRGEKPNFGISSLHNTPEARLQATRTWWTEVIKLTFAPEVANDNLIDALIARFEGEAGYILRPNVVSVLKQLHAQPDTILGVISNSDVRIGNVLQALGIRKYFCNITLSSNCGFEKPDPRIFSSALRSLIVSRNKGESPSDFRGIHVGNEWQTDCQGALRAGWRAVLLQEKSSPEPDLRVDTASITIIEDLADLLLPGFTLYE